MRSVRQVVVVLALGVAGCWRPWTPMHASTSTRMDSSPAGALARVVFYRRWEEHHPQHSALYNPTPVHVIDETGRLLGDLAPDTWFSADVAAGEHFFVAYHDQTLGTHEASVLRAKVSPSRNYFVELVRAEASRLFGGGRLRLVRAPAPLKPPSQLIGMETDGPSARVWTDHAAAAVRARIEEARERLAEGQFEVLREEDGFVAESLAGE